jgi:hypothetical protein
MALIGIAVLVASAAGQQKKDEPRRADGKEQDGKKQAEMRTGGKALTLAKLVARQWEMDQEVYEAGDTNNSLVVEKVKEAHEKERRAWIGKRVEGLAYVST